MVGYPSGQREQTVNLSASPSKVRVLPPPLEFAPRGMSGSSSAGRASAFQAECRGFEPRLPLNFFCMWVFAWREYLRRRSSAVEHVLGKDGVTGSSPVVGSGFDFYGASLLERWVSTGW